MVIDKLALVLLKALNKDAAINWLEERKEVLEKTPSVSPDAHKALIENFGEECANLLCENAPICMSFVLRELILLQMRLIKEEYYMMTLKVQLQFIKKNGIIKWLVPRD